MKIGESAQKVLQELTSRDDWFDKYLYLIQLGSRLPELSPDERIETYAIPGCQSELWIKGELKIGRLHFTAYSDSQITRGLVMLLLVVCNNATPREILDSDFTFLKQTGVQTNLSPSRAQGLGAMVKRIKHIASQAIAG